MSNPYASFNIKDRFGSQPRPVGGLNFGAQSPMPSGGFRPSSSPMQSVGSMLMSRLTGGNGPDTGEDEGGPWYKNPNVLAAGLNTLGGVASGVMASRANSQQQALEREKFEYEKKQREDEQSRKAALAEYMRPILDRVMGGAAPQPFQAPRYGGG